MAGEGIVKPIWRWTIGDVSEVGWEILSESVRLATKVYPEFDFVICHNNLTPEKEDVLRKFSVPLLRQDDLIKRQDSGSKMDFFWKLVPPRIRLDSHELWVDNDLLILDRIPYIDEWLNNSDAAIISESSVGLKNWYGRFENMIDPCIAECCAGLFGLPPGFDFGEEVEKLSDGLVEYDEQGLVVYVVTNFDRCVFVPNKTLTMLGRWRVFFSSCNQSYEFGRRRTFFSSDFPEGSSSDLPEGIHFVGSNRADNEYWAPWFFYKLSTMP